MAELVGAGQRLLFMKVGVHAKESLESIIERKTREIEDAGFAMWGYGGNTCYPKVVQPFAQEAEREQKTIYLVMQRMTSNHFAEQVRADEYSVDGVNWAEIDPNINVRGSRFALVIDSLESADFDLPLARTEVAVGNCTGRSGDRYIAGRVDKACLRLREAAVGEPVEGSKVVRIGLSARLRAPYAVFLRNR